MHYIESSKLKQQPEVYSGINSSESWIIKEPFLHDLVNSLPEDSKILDVGCGNGSFLLRLRALGFTSLYGADIANYLVDTNLEHQVLDLNVERLVQADDSLDVVTAFQVFEHLENYFLLEQEIARVLRPGGMFVMAVPNPYNIFYKAKFLLTDDMPGFNLHNNHLLFLTRDVFVKTFLRDFDLVETYYRKGPVPMLGRLNIIPGVKVKAKTRLLPRNKACSDRVCYVMRKKAAG